MLKKLTLSQKKRLDILGAAKQEFVEYGFELANMERITTAAEVSKRTLYRHFETKSVLFESVLIAINDSINSNKSYPFDDRKSTELQLSEISYQEIEVMYSAYGMPFARSILMEFLRQPEMANKLIKNTYTSRAVTQWFEDAIEAGRLKSSDSKLMTDVYVSLFQGLLFWPQAMNTQLNLDDNETKIKVDTVTSVFLQSYGLA